MNPAITNALKLAVTTTALTALSFYVAGQLATKAPEGLSQPQRTNIVDAVSVPAPQPK